MSGGEPRDVVGAGVITTGKQLASDGAGRLYWGDREGCRVSTVRLDGTGEQECVGIAVDSDHLYWTQKGPAKGGRGRIFRAGLRLPAGEDPASRRDVELLGDALPEPIDLEVHNGFLHWTDRGAGPAGNTLNRAPLPAVGAEGAEPQILARDFQETIGLAIDGDAGLAQVSELGGRIFAVELGLGGSTAGRRLTADLKTPVTGIAGCPRAQTVRR